MSREKKVFKLIYFILAFSLMHLNRLEEAILIEKEIVQLDPTYNNIVNLAKSLESIGKTDEAR